MPQGSTYCGSLVANLPYVWACCAVTYACDGTKKRDSYTSNCWSYSPDGCWGDGFCDRTCRGTSAPTDTRSNTIKSQGCCPRALLGQDGSAPNGLGNAHNANLCIGSSANIKIGNLFQSLEVGKLTLSYNSSDTINGSLGLKWTHNYYIQLTALSDNLTLKLKNENGNIIYFRKSGNTYYPEAISADHSWIVKNSNGSYTRTAKNGIVHEFDSSGRLTSIRDRNNNTTTLTYGSFLRSITDQNGRTTSITTAAGGLITAITDPMGRTYTLGYASTFLTSITDPLGNAWQFTTVRDKC